MAPVKLTDKDVDALIRVVATESDPKLAWSHPEAYTAQVHGIVDTVLNRVASGRWGSSVASVANAKNQFSAINGPKNSKYKVWGSVDKVPDSLVPAPLRNVVTSWLTKRGGGTPSSVGGSLHYANPFFSDASNLKWINKLDGPKLGYGKSIHYHGTTAGYSPVEAQVIYGGGINRLNDIHDRQAAAQGFGEIAPTALKRPAFFNETGAPPIPLPRRIAPAQSLMSESKAPSLADLPMKSVPNLRPAGQPLSQPVLPKPVTPKVAYLPTGKQVEIGRLYKIGNDVVRGGVGADGKGTLTKVSAGMADVLFDKGIAGSVARHFAADQVRNGVKQIASAAPGVIGAFPKVASDAASTGSRFLGDLFGGRPAPALPKPGTPAQSLMSSRSNSGPYDPIGRGASFSDLKTFTAPPRATVPPTPAAPKTTSKTVTETIMVKNPAWGQVNPVAVNKLQDIHDREDARIMAAQGLPATPPPVPQYIPKTISRTIQVPLPVAPTPAPVAQKLLARANAMPPPLTLQGALQGWWNGTPLGSGINAIFGNKPQPTTGGGLLGAAFSMLPRQQTALNIAAQAQRDPLGYAIGQANRASPTPTYDVSGGNNAFNPASVQNSSRWQTGY